MLKFTYVRSVRLSLWLFLLAMTAMGCVNDHLTSESENLDDRVGINLALPGMSFKAGAAAITDETVARVRVFAFDRYRAGRCVLNRLIDSPQAPFRFEINSGAYDFCFVMNEPDTRTDTAVGTPENTQLKAVDSREQLDDFNVVHSQLVSPEGLYVMSATQANVLVNAIPVRIGDGCWQASVTYTDAAGATHTDASELAMNAYRLATRVNLRLVKKKDGAPVTNAKIVKITGLPASVPVLDGMASAPPVVSEVALTAQPALPSYPADGSTYAGYTAIVPSYLFRPQNDKAQAAQLYVKLADETAPRIMALGHQLPKAGAETDYTLHRNTLYHITGNVSDRLELDIKVLDWDELALAPKLGWKWNRNNNQIFLSTSSPVGLRRSGYLTADDYSLKYIKTRVLNSDLRVECKYESNYAPMSDRDKPAYSGYVNHLATYGNSDIVLRQVNDSVFHNEATSIDPSKQVVVELTFPDKSTQQITVYLNRTEFRDRIWMDRNMGGTVPHSEGGYYANKKMMPNWDFNPLVACPSGYVRPDPSLFVQYTQNKEWFNVTTRGDRNLVKGENCAQDKRTGQVLSFARSGLWFYDRGSRIKYLDYQTAGYIWSSSDIYEIGLLAGGFNYYTNSDSGAQATLRDERAAGIRCVKQQ